MFNSQVVDVEDRVQICDPFSFINEKDRKLLFSKLREFINKAVEKNFLWDDIDPEKLFYQCGEYLTLPLSGNGTIYTCAVWGSNNGIRLVGFNKKFENAPDGSRKAYLDPSDASEGKGQKSNINEVLSIIEDNTNGNEIPGIPLKNFSSIAILQSLGNIDV